MIQAEMPDTKPIGLEPEPGKAKRPPRKGPSLRAIGSSIARGTGRVVKAVRDFRLPLDLKAIDEMDRAHYRLAIGALLVVIAVMLIAGIFAFGITLKGTEQTMVPDIRGQDLAQALIKLQEKELYPRIALRYTANPEDRGRVLEESPLPGSIVKAGRRINLVISRGPVVDRVGDYVGKDIEELRSQLQALFASGKALVTIKDPPIYVYDVAKPGLILQQKPLPDTELSGPVQLELVVSRGPEKAKATVPAIVGLDIAAGLDALGKEGLPVIAVMRDAVKGEKAGIVSSTSPATGSQLPSGSPVDIVVTRPSDKDLVSGVFTQDLPNYPYPLRLSLDAIKPSGDRTSLYKVNHPGGRIAVPFAVSDGTVLVLSVLDREVARVEERKP